MMKLLLVALVLAVAQAEEISGDWRTVAIAADHIEKIQEGGRLRLYVRHLECLSECQGLDITFQVKPDDHCTLITVRGKQSEEGVYRASYEGQNRYSVIKQAEGFIVFYNENVDTEGKKTKMVYVLGKGEDLNAEQIGKLEEYVESRHIPKDNIRYVKDADTCP